MRAIHQAGLPACAVLRPDGLHVELQDIGPDHLIDSFMHETVKRVPARQTSIEITEAELVKLTPASPPAGLIFHVARCGSTLVSQLLRQHEQLVVYSEPLPVNDVVLSRLKEKRSAQVGALRALGALFAQHARKPYVLKLSSWNTLFCDLWAEAFPSTPWVFCVRDPVEVCVSLLQQQPGWLREPRLFSSRVDPDGVARTAEDYVAHMYAAFCKGTYQLDAKCGKLVRYESLPEAVWVAVGPHFGFAIDDRLKGRMSAASRTYSKSPAGNTAQFVPDKIKKQATASPELLQAIDAIARPALEHLTARFQDR